ncbi:MAG: c-type cytochrome [Anaerolineae bacterium]
MKKMLLVSSLVFSAVLLFLGWDAYDQEWKRYERAYYTITLLNARSEREREWIRGQRLEIQQIQVEGLSRIDRCPTCHLAVENPAFAAAPEPFRAHEPPLDAHPPEQFGCTVCHAGEGRAVTTLAAHGEQGEWPTRLLKGEYMQAACYGCHGEDTLPPEAVAGVVLGKRLMNQYKCLRCHQVNGEGSEGPDLSTVGSRRDWIWTYAHLLNPQAMSPGSTMPDFPFTGDEARYLTIYLLTLLGDREEVNDARFLVREGSQPVTASVTMAEGQKQPDALLGMELIPVPRYEGRELFKGAGCHYCHRIGQDGGEVGPALTYIGRKQDKEWFTRWLRDPAAVLPQGKMPRIFLNENQIEALAEYLTTLI